MPSVVARIFRVRCSDDQGIVFSLILCALALGISGARATDWVHADDQLLIGHDFAHLVIPDHRDGSVRAFLNMGDLPSNSVPEEELENIRTTAVHQLGNKVSLVPQRQDADLLIQIRAYKSINYAIRNSKHVPAQGLILVGFCKLPVSETTTDCENFNYYYFANQRPIDLFQKLFAMSLDSVFRKTDR